MKTRTFVFILTFVLAVLIITGSFVSASDIAVFFQAVKSGDIAEVKRLIEAGANINAQTYNGLTALMCASEWGYTKVVKLLLEAGADVEGAEEIAPTEEPETEETPSEA